MLGHFWLHQRMEQVATPSVPVVPDQDKTPQLEFSRCPCASAITPPRAGQKRKSQNVKNVVTPVKGETIGGTPMSPTGSRVTAGPSLGLRRQLLCGTRQTRATTRTMEEVMGQKNRAAMFDRHVFAVLVRFLKTPEAMMIRRVCRYYNRMVSTEPLMTHLRLSRTGWTNRDVQSFFATLDVTNIQSMVFLCEVKSLKCLYAAISRMPNLTSLTLSPWIPALFGCYRSSCCEGIIRLLLAFPQITTLNWWSETNPTCKDILRPFSRHGIRPLRGPLEFTAAEVKEYAINPWDGELGVVPKWPPESSQQAVETPPRTPAEWSMRASLQRIMTQRGQVCRWGEIGSCVTINPTYGGRDWRVYAFTRCDKCNKNACYHCGRVDLASAVKSNMSYQICAHCEKSLLCMQCACVGRRDYPPPETRWICSACTRTMTTLDERVPVPVPAPAECGT
jgi:hypothetical protein